MKIETKIKKNMKYIGTKEVNAKPMNADEAEKLGYNINSHIHEDGYEVTYKDGYKSWSPKLIFDEAYNRSETFLDRLKIEHDELFSKFEKCAQFVDSDKFREVIKDNYSAFLLSLQRDVMGRYLSILEQRIDITNGDNEIMTLPRMSFGIAIEALKSGLAIRRSGWNGKGLFVIKQIPALITEDIIPKMTSLPQSAKDLILKNKKFINYSSQCLIYNENNGCADSWVPSISDTFADDWEIVK